MKRDEIGKAMRSCYPEFMAKKKNVLGAAAVIDGDLHDATAGSSLDDVDDFDDVEQFLAEHTDLPHEEPEAYEETEVAEALAVSWKDKRQELSRLQKARRFTQAQDAAVRSEWKWKS